MLDHPKCPPPALTQACVDPGFWTLDIQKFSGLLSELALKSLQLPAVIPVPGH